MTLLSAKLATVHKTGQTVGDMSGEDPITVWIEELRGADNVAAAKLWESFRAATLSVSAQ